MQYRKALVLIHTEAKRAPSWKCPAAMDHHGSQPRQTVPPFGIFFTLNFSTFRHKPKSSHQNRDGVFPAKMMVVVMMPIEAEEPKHCLDKAPI
jgi:hypothetical protein